MKLRTYQTRINAAVLIFLKGTAQRGQVYAPTGSGKTVCFIESIRDAIKMGAKNIALIHPRIALSQDQLKRLQAGFGTSIHFTSFHSGGHVNGRSKIREKNTTVRSVLETIISQTDGIHITLSSYNSFSKISDIEFDLLICDEAHNFVEDQFYKWLPEIKARKILFYTATPIALFIEDSKKDDQEDKYMMNINLFGKVLEAVAPTELIKAGYIVAPLIHKMNVTSDETHDAADPTSLIARAYVAQWKETSGDGMPYAQMLVAAPGLPEMEILQNNLVKFWDCIKSESGGRLENVDVYCISSDGEFCNGRLIPGGRFEALNMIKDSGKNAVVVHYDTLAEGIDIDSLTGAFIMRKLSMAKFIQTIGRCGRPFLQDLDSKFEPKKESYEFEKIDTRMKRRCIVTIPVIDGKFIANHMSKEWCEAFISAGYDDLWTYVHEKESTPTGKGGGKKGDDDNKYSVVQSHLIDRLVVDLEALFEGGL